MTDAYNQIRNDILTGVIKPGERLPEEQIAARLQLSRTPVREAIRRLTAEGLVIYSTNRGAAARMYQFEDVRDAYNLRAQVESYAASLAAQHASFEDCERLREANMECQQMADMCLQERTDNNVLAMVKANQAFHTIIAELSGNRYLRDFMKTVVSLPVAFNGFRWFSPSAFQESVRHHFVILAAIEHRDPDQARAVMTSHIYHGRDHVLTNINQVLDEN
ncbi:GntR family transcriptional regulator [Alicyclobacillus ferrooxydans]|uniref:HTH gntR-type domain-containing protein n=1 Tax=Alicyclobacillus ferrooxydans TaxID=471514 RepID=A0A0P9CZD9_9BACL|nr:GntR family transcriptional regulator [Alicyclobacillus ferrooxydans]KPV42434.1 hypothetical protein AN477_17720 [Alicyclobacillus ferrooxydans]